MRDNEALIRLLIDRGLQITTAESCTGGMIAALLTEVPDASRVFSRGFVTYSDAAKRDLLQVPGAVLDAHTAISAECAAAMTAGALAAASADCAIAVTGLAGPGGGTKEQPVGLVYIGCAAPGKRRTERCFFQGDRQEVRAQAAARAIRLLLELLTED